MKGKYPEYIRVRLKIGEPTPDDGFNYYVPAYFTDNAVNNNPEAGVDTRSFEVDLTPEKLIENYCKEVAPGNDELFKIGLECLTLRKG